MSDPALSARYARAGFRRVPGWLTPLAALEFVELLEEQARLGLRGPVCEVGTHLGRTFILLHLLTRPGEHAAAFDLYEVRDAADGAERKRRLREYLARHGGDVARIDIVDCDSRALGPERVIEHCRGRPRLFSIDAGRSAADVYSDLALATRSIAPGGLVSLTDYFQERWPEVSEGACRFMRESGGLVPVAIGGNKFFFTNDAGHATRYRAALAARFGHQCRSATMFGAPVTLVRDATLRTWLVRTRLWRALRDTSLGGRLRQIGVRGR